jgi:hypothetical protein
MPTKRTPSNNALILSIKSAIASSDVDQARILLRKALKNPTSEIYELASQVALNNEQKRSFLKKAQELGVKNQATKKVIAPSKSSTTLHYNYEDQTTTETIASPKSSTKFMYDEKQRKSKKTQRIGVASKADKPNKKIVQEEKISKIPHSKKAIIEPSTKPKKKVDVQVKNDIELNDNPNKKAKYYLIALLVLFMFCVCCICSITGWVISEELLYELDLY